ncbi:MAG TPA: glycosyltransferase family 39 protein [Polyangiaceae bacterium]|nr:glycosyltransferase family 39 protein [Polyangiaceae bacterium]
MSKSAPAATWSLWQPLVTRFGPARTFGIAEAAMLVCVLLAIYLRTRGMFGSVIPLWLDEAGWARLLLTQPLLEPSIRPLGFMAVSKWMTTLLGPTEVALRLFPWMAGVLSSVLAVPLAHRLFTSKPARLLLVASIAFHPYAIDYSKEFKPYSISLMLHLACMFGALSYAKQRRPGTLGATIVLALLAVLFAQDIVFAYPAIYLILAIAAYRDRLKRHLIAIAVGAALTIALLAALTLFFWRDLGVTGNESAADFWGDKYDVFFLAGNGDESRARWSARKYLEIATFPGERRTTFQPRGPLDDEKVATLAAIDAGVWALLHLVGLAALLRQRRLLELLALALPLWTLFIFNQAGVWPFGAFRTNLFVLAYSIPIAAFAIEPRDPSKARGWQTFAVLAMVVVPLLAFERDWHKRKVYAGNSAFLEAVSALIKLHDERGAPAGAPLVLDAYSCRVWSYYFGIHPHHGALARDLRERFKRRCTGFKGSALVLGTRVLRKQRERVWVMLTGVSETDEERLSTLQRSPRLDVTSVAVGSKAALVVTLDRKGRAP